MTSVRLRLEVDVLLVEVNHSMVEITKKLKLEVLDYMQSMLINQNVNLIKTKISKNYMLNS